jgi:hypothetical protein
MRLSMDRVVNIMTAAMALTVTVAGVAITWKTLSGPATPPRPVPYKVGEILDLPVPYPVVLRRVTWKFQTKQIDCVSRLSERFGWLAASPTTERRRH